MNRGDKRANRKGKSVPILWEEARVHVDHRAHKGVDDGRRDEVPKGNNNTEVEGVRNVRHARKLNRRLGVPLVHRHSLVTTPFAHLKILLIFLVEWIYVGVIRGGNRDQTRLLALSVRDNLETRHEPLLFALVERTCVLLVQSSQSWQGDFV